MITDEAISRLTPAERRDLIDRLMRPADELGPGLDRLRRTRTVRLALLAASALVLVPWIGYLAWTLPRHYVAHHWVGTWVGFDVLLVAAMVTTLVLAVQRRMLVVLAAFSTGVLLVVDAWFDVMTSAPADRIWSVLLAVFGELPFAAVLFTAAVTVIRLVAVRFYRIEPGMRVWQVRFPLPEPADPGR